MNSELLELKEAGIIQGEDNIEDIIREIDQENVILHLFKQNLIDETLFTEYYQQRFDYEEVILSDINVDDEQLQLLPEEIMKNYFIIPISIEDNKLILLMADPLDFEARSVAESFAGMKVIPKIGKYSDIGGFFESRFGVESSIKNIINNLESKDLSAIAFSSLESKVFQASNQSGPVTKLLHLIISHAIHEAASDIHIEPTTKEIVVRLRIDGVLHKVMSLPKSTMNSLITSIKILARLDIAEKRIPLDGGFQARVEDRIFDIRVSTFPIIEGEKVAIRLLDKKELSFSLAELGMSKHVLTGFEQMIRQNYGIILVTGPTGSGKTTTLYTALNEIKSIEKNIVTIEDPVEYHLDLINQSQVNSKAGLTFTKGLRSFLRQDPDIILLGEIRDKETAEIAFQAAMTGHLVFTTLHTNDASSAVTRLIDMGIPSYLISSSVIGVLSQRLIRKSCTRCQQEYQPDKSSLKWMKNIIKNSQTLQKILGAKGLENITFHQGVGCDACKNTRYKGRVGVFELLSFSDNIRNMVHQPGVTSNEVRTKAMEDGMISFAEDAIEKVLAGVTTAEEIVRVLR